MPYEEDQANVLEAAFKKDNFGHKIALQNNRSAVLSPDGTGKQIASNSDVHSSGRAIRRGYEGKVIKRLPQPVASHHSPRSSPSTVPRSSPVVPRVDLVDSNSALIPDLLTNTPASLSGSGFRPPENLGSIWKEGFVAKEAKIRGWYQRWLVLTGEHLSTYEDKKQKMHLDISQITKAEVGKLDPKNRGVEFSVGTLRKPYNFRAPTVEEAQEWVDAINFAARSKRRSSTSHTASISNRATPSNAELNAGFNVGSTTNTTTTTTSQPYPPDQSVVQTTSSPALPHYQQPPFAGTPPLQPDQQAYMGSSPMQPTQTYTGAPPMGQPFCGTPSFNSGQPPQPHYNPFQGNQPGPPHLNTPPGPQQTYPPVNPAYQQSPYMSNQPPSYGTSMPPQPMGYPPQPQGYPPSMLGQQPYPPQPMGQQPMQQYPYSYPPQQSAPQMGPPNGQYTLPNQFGQMNLNSGNGR
jgi:hypothetical protein